MSVTLSPRLFNCKVGSSKPNQSQGYKVGLTPSWLRCNLKMLENQKDSWYKSATRGCPASSPYLPSYPAGVVTIAVVFAEWRTQKVSRLIVPDKYLISLTLKCLNRLNTIRPRLSSSFYSQNPSFIGDRDSSPCSIITMWGLDDVKSFHQWEVAVGLVCLTIHARSST